MKWIKLFENFNEITNIVIIGGGISSLYSAKMCIFVLKYINLLVIDSNI